MAKPSYAPTDADLDLTTPEERRARKIRRWLLIGGTLFLLIAASIWYLGQPARKAIKAWQARRLASEAVELAEKSDWNAATQKARDAYQLDQGEPAVWRAAGQLLTRANQNAGALEWWRKLEQAGQLRIDDRRAYGGAALASGDLSAAATQIDYLLAQPKVPAPIDYLLAGQLAARRGDELQAWDYAERALRDPRASSFQKLSGAILILSLPVQDPTIHLRAWHAIEELARNSGDEASLDALSFVAQQEKPMSAATIEENTELSLARTAASLPGASLSPSEIAESLEKHPKARPYHQLLAMRLRAREEPTRAAEILDQAIARFRGSDDETLIALNTWLYKEGRYQTLLDIVPPERATRRHELFLQYLDALGALGRFQEVKELLSSSEVRLDPVSQHMYLATARERLGEVTGTTNEWQRALEAVDSAEKGMALGTYAERAGASEIARDAYGQAVSSAPHLRAAYDGQVRAARSLGKTAEAHKVLKEICRLWPTDQHARLEEIYLRLLLGASGSEAEQAVREAETFLIQEPMGWQARATLALAQLRLGHSAAALKAFSGMEAVESSPVGPLAVRAVALDANGWKEGARGDANTLAAAPLLPEERALIAPLLRH